MTPTDLLRLIRNDLEFIRGHNKIPQDVRELVSSDLKKINKHLNNK